MITNVPILTTSHIYFSFKGWENVLFELGSERVKGFSYQFTGLHTTFTNGGPLVKVKLWGDNTFTPKSDQVQISPVASPVILHHTV